MRLNRANLQKIRNNAMRLHGGVAGDPKYYRSSFASTLRDFETEVSNG